MLIDELPWNKHRRHCYVNCKGYWLNIFKYDENNYTIYKNPGNYIVGEGILNDMARWERVDELTLECILQELWDNPGR